MPPPAEEAEKRLLALGNAEAAACAARYFKSGTGQYGEGDIFLAIRVPIIRRLAAEFRDLPEVDVLPLLGSKFHEVRLLALLILVKLASNGDQASKRRVFDLYLANTRFVNNWDLVDSSAREIVGGYHLDKDRGPLRDLARSESLWEQRIAIIQPRPLALVLVEWHGIPARVGDAIHYDDDHRANARMFGELADQAW